MAPARALHRVGQSPSLRDIWWVHNTITLRVALNIDKVNVDQLPLRVLGLSKLGSCGCPEILQTLQPQQGVAGPGILGFLAVLGSIKSRRNFRPSYWSFFTNEIYKKSYLNEVLRTLRRFLRVWLGRFRVTWFRSNILFIVFLYIIQVDLLKGNWLFHDRRSWLGSHLGLV